MLDENEEVGGLETRDPWRHDSDECRRGSALLLIFSLCRHNINISRRKCLIYIFYTFARVSLKFYLQTNDLIKFFLTKTVLTNFRLTLFILFCFEFGYFSYVS